MREIKFRGWDQRDCAMWEFDLWEAAQFKDKQMHLMQFTGLLDKNGVEIYEGDILEGGYVVKWHLNRWALFLGEQVEGSLDNECEIIGNVWQNGAQKSGWKKKNPERMAHLKARRYARERNAEGSHTFEEWRALKEKHNQCCVGCGAEKRLTKDHIVPLSEGGTDYITNIQPMCRSCNSRKWKHPHLINNNEV